MIDRINKLRENISYARSRISNMRKELEALLIKEAESKPRFLVDTVRPQLGSEIIAYDQHGNPTVTNANETWPIDAFDYGYTHWTYTA